MFTQQYSEEKFCCSNLECLGHSSESGLCLNAHLLLLGVEQCDVIVNISSYEEKLKLFEWP